jgi:hypothetical protein
MVSSRWASKAPRAQVEMLVPPVLERRVHTKVPEALPCGGAYLYGYPLSQPAV